MPNIRLLIEYDGSRFHGWQSQPGLRTIQSELQRVIGQVLGHEISTVVASGRTDAGVHAKGQVCNFLIDREIDLERLKHSVSSLLKGEVSVLEADFVDENFNSCRDAIAKQYTYTILNRPSPAVLDHGRVWHVARGLNIELMQVEAASLVGIHDFQSLRASGCGARSSIKEIYTSEISFEPPYVRYTVIGQGFLKQLVRNIVGTLVNFSDGKISAANMAELLELKNREAAGVTAPAHGLCLDWVKY